VVVAIVGSRRGLNWDKVRAKIQHIVTREDVGLVVSGGAIGVDRMAETLALAAGKRVHSIRPDWKKFGRRAGMLRNAEIVDMADEIHAFWDGESPGTAGTIAIARRARKPLFVYNGDGGIG
jgi:hypothetical protein